MEQERQVSASDLKREVAFALWELQFGKDPAPVVRSMLLRMWLLAEGAELLKKECAVSGCGIQAYARGWCQKHYQRWRRHGDTSSMHGEHERRDLLSQAFITGRVHARRGSRCATDKATELFGGGVAAAYERGYRYEMERQAP